MTTSAPRRRTRLRAIAAALGATLALTLTACQDDEETGSIGETAPQSPSVQMPADPESDDEATADGAEDGGTGEAGGEAPGDGAGEGDGAEEYPGTHTPGDGTLEGGAGESAEDTVPCTDANTQLTVTPVERPINHVLLTATNTGTETCFAWYAPYLRFDDAQAPTPRIEDSVPQAVVGLAPGESAYAAILTSDPTGEAPDTRIATSLGVQFSGPDDQGTGDLTEVALPDGELYMDSSAQVTYWQSSPDLALIW
ncbi:DUF4232 domain-containing protein [Streptomyces sp. NPDC049879]|uniref:DUF4232 domain-containing protein n=1 Tax=Streptomyces sp. NPDC049879 TaxID=3365598 RepID=UPI0037A0579F